VKLKGHISSPNPESSAVGSELTKLIAERLNEIVDEETTRKLGELNVVTEVSEMANGSVRIRFRPLSAYSPLAVDTGKSLREAALSVDGVKAVRVECSGHMMDDLVNRIVNKEDIRQKTAK
jgi:metal-sulfur cluster biosynthetic enzyme